MALPTFVLTERVRSLLRLTPDDLVFLHERHPHLALAPTGRRGRWLVTPRSRVGVIHAPSCRLVIQPKLPLANVWYLLDPDGRLPVTADGDAPAGGDGLLGLVARLFEAGLRARLAVGLARGYAERSGQGGVLQGRPDIAAQLRENPLLKDRLHWLGDDLTTDIPCNQVVRATLEVLLGSGLLSTDLRASLRATLPAFEGVTPGRATGGHPPEFRQARCASVGEYGPLLGLCQLILKGLSPDETGLSRGPSFLLDLERVWEGYVTRCVRRAFATVAKAVLRTQDRFFIPGADADPPDLTLRPDAVVEVAGQPTLVVDAKWKRPRPGKLIRTDAYQALAYAVGVHAPRTILVYPGRRDVQRVYRPHGSECTLEVRTLRVVGSAAACDRAARRFGRVLRRG